MTEDVAELSETGRLTKLPGIGKGTAARVRQFLNEGKVDVHQELLEAIPSGLPALLAIQGLGPKKIALMWHRAGVDSIESLRAAIDAGTLTDLPGMGTKTVERILQGVEFLDRSHGRTPIGLALPVAKAIADAVVGQTLQVTAIGVHRVDLPIAVTDGHEGYLVAVSCRGHVAAVGGQLRGDSAVIRRHDVEATVSTIIPIVATSINDATVRQPKWISAEGITVHAAQDAPTRPLGDIVQNVNARPPVAGRGGVKDDTVTIRRPAWPRILQVLAHLHQIAAVSVGHVQSHSIAALTVDGDP